ncbi:Transcriptional regulator, MerR family [Streptococcus constellatus]|nr:Transcriptional regulator, MerR family [Streptococcus constellatus]
MDKYTLQKHISLRIRHLRKKKQMTQGELSEKADLGINYIYNVENKNLNIKLETLEKIITALEVTEAEFFNFLNQEADSEIMKTFEQISELPISKRRKLLNAINLILEILE